METNICVCLRCTKIFHSEILGVTYSRLSPTHGCHLLMVVTYSRLSPTRGCHLLMVVTYSRLSPTHGCHLLTVVTYSWHHYLDYIIQFSIITVLRYYHTVHVVYMQKVCHKILPYLSCSIHTKKALLIHTAVLLMLPYC